MTAFACPLGNGSGSREDLGARTARSALTDSESTVEELLDWLALCRERAAARIRRVPLGELDGWGFDPETGNLSHDSGRFFSVEGLEVHTDHHARGTWRQPIINQSDIAVLGVLAKEFDGVLHFLMQAKLEPGNVNAIQLSPTVQATSSNYGRAHHGSATPCVEYFTDPGRARVLTDALQSEQGTWFLHKRNRNVIVETSEEVEVRDNFRWLTLGQIHALLRVPNVVNMDARTVLGALPFAPAANPSARLRTTDERFGRALRRSLGVGEAADPARMTEILSWITRQRSRHVLVTRPVPLREVHDWSLGPRGLTHRHGRYFDVVGVTVTAEGREVSSWSQPLLRPCGTGVNALLVREFDGIVHVLVRITVEPGYRETVELGPTVQFRPHDHAHLPASRWPRFHDVVSSASGTVHYDVVQSEEGGRFHHALNRYLVVEVGAEFPTSVPEDFAWLTLGQLVALQRHSNYLNIEARSLVCCLQTLW
ncbi:NDP-hexose 2,3-dehydratase family protein [Actinopolyspora mortivallis]|uniref:NDP-hexose 2,3-dehydratase n=1 Tax=Actinopolyspora mortivallis TaxID=33906 RepID=A0A2T0GYS3_ACTMO|nr:NDP-hexose 2,3-dehydratase family protein [Actinopolyspora mortivallis]PRW64247.1 NDP-hexose 2,3-dehydratase [Actinopolyspora mortivallis]